MKKLQHVYHLIIADTAWERLQHLLVRGPHEMAYAFLQRDFANCDRKLFASHIYFPSSAAEAQSVRQGEEDLIVFSPSDRSSSCDIPGEMTVYERPYDQVFINMQVGLSQSRKGWRGTIIHQDGTDQLKSLRVERLSIQTGTPQIWEQRPASANHADDVRMSNKQGPKLPLIRPTLERRPIPKLLGQEVILFGANSLGSLTATCLANQGISKLDLVDPHCVDSHDLGSDLFIDQNEIGRNRALAVAKGIHQLSPNLRLNVFQQKANHMAMLDRVAKADMVITADVDENTRYVAALLAHSTGKPHLDILHRVKPGGTRFEIRFVFQRGCAVCSGGVDNPLEVIKSLVNSQPEEATRPATEFNEPNRRSFPTNLYAASTVVEIYLNWVKGQIPESTLFEVSWKPTGGVEHRQSSIDGQEDCSICG